jgi:hypothetical protein
MGRRHRAVRQSGEECTVMGMAREGMWGVCRVIVLRGMEC